MKSRALKFKLLCGLQGCIPLDPTSLSEVDSAAEFINIIDKFRVGIRKFNDRNPMIAWNPAPPFKEDTTLNDIIHDIVNSRKFMNFPNVDPNDYQQVFELNFATETITLCKIRSAEHPFVELEELGSMHINTMFSNWKDVFYSHIDDSWIDDMTFLEEIVAEEESIYDYMKPKMEEALATVEFELWDMLFTTNAISGQPLQEGEYVTITYSGSGDDGDIDHVSVYSKNEVVPYFLGYFGKLFSKEDSDNFNSKIWIMVGCRAPGFVNDEGGYGKITISHTKFQWDHFDYIRETDHTIGIHHEFEEKDSAIKHIVPLPYEVTEALSATTPKTKPEVTLADIVKEHHPEVYKPGSDYDIDKSLPF